MSGAPKQPFWQRSPAYRAGRGVQFKWAFRAWAQRNTTERERIERRFHRRSKKAAV